MTEFKFQIHGARHIGKDEKRRPCNGDFAKVGYCSARSCDKENCIEYKCRSCKLETSDCDGIESKCSEVEGFEYAYQKFEDEKATEAYAKEIEGIELVTPDPCQKHNDVSCPECFMGD